MKFKTKLGGLLLITTSLCGTAALAQAATQAAPTTTSQDEESVDISVPGGSSGEIVVIGSKIPNTIRASREVVSVLSQADIARTGEGDIAGALQRVSGLSVVGGRFVYVRGLGERYSLALLNGLPIPSPDPLRRVVPLDLFATSVLASTVVQKSYSVNFPGEFGGGVINLTTRAVPEKFFISVGGSIGANTATTGQLGYTYKGSSTDWTGFDNGTRTIPPLLQAANNSGNQLIVGKNFTLKQAQDITASLNNAQTNVIFRNTDLPANFDLDFSAGNAWDVGDNRYGFVLSAGWKNGWQTKAGLQQIATSARPATPGGLPVLNPDQNFQFVSTENRAVVNGLLGLGAEIGAHKIRLTTLYINDTIKEARIQSGYDNVTLPDELLNRSATAFFRRQLMQTQAVGEFKFDNLTLDLRGTYANSKRLSPYERFNNYAYRTSVQGVQINDYVNDLSTQGQTSTISFSRLNENVFGGGADLGYKFENGPFPIRLTAGYAFNDNRRRSSRRDYAFRTEEGALPIAVSQERPDYLLSDYNIYTYGIYLEERSGTAGAAEYNASLTVHAGYGQLEIEPMDGVQLVAGVRYETAVERYSPVNLFGATGDFLTPTELRNHYFLPAATLTWNFAPDMQFRLSASKTIARPQFRELAPQNYLDTDTDRTSFGNQFLVDSQLFNLEARYEYYFGRDQRLSVSGFYKKITNPIESVNSITTSSFLTTYANAPRATLYGVETEVQKYFPLDWLGSSDLITSRRLMVSANYTYSKSNIQIRAGDTTLAPINGRVADASDFFRDGQPLTGQSDHVANIQIGFQDQDSLSEQTLLLNYSSDRVTVRGSALSPDFVERPGFQLDLVLRQGFSLFGVALEAKLEARNLTNTRYQEFQSLNNTRVDNNSYKRGRTFQAGLTANF